MMASFSLHAEIVTRLLWKEKIMAIYVNTNVSSLHVGVQWNSETKSEADLYQPLFFYKELKWVKEITGI